MTIVILYFYCVGQQPEDKDSRMDSAMMCAALQLSTHDLTEQGPMLVSSIIKKLWELMIGSLHQDF
jgi:hypothetical protein